MSKLGKKQNIKNSDWLNAVADIENIISKKELDKKVKETVAEIKRKVKGKKAAFAWSAGKDSLVLEHICYDAGIKE